MSAPEGVAWTPALIHKIVGGIALIIVAFGAGLWALQSHSDSALRAYADTQVAVAQKALLDGCRRGDLKSAYELANHADGPERAALARELQPIVWCQESVRTGSTVLVPLTVQRAYVTTVVDEACWPVLSDFAPVKIVDCDELPSHTQRG